MEKKYFEISKKIYLYDTDATDIVYYAKHLEWMEMARIDMIGTVYKPLKRIIAEDGVTFMPINVNINYKASSTLEDIVKVRVSFKEIEKIKIILDYKVVKEVEGKEVLVSEAEITMLCVNTEKGRPSKIPETLLNAIREWEVK